jgi:adenylyltransferase/sulfurtransferase
VPKVEAAVETLERVGGPSQLLPKVAHFDTRNIHELTAGSALILDGTDNLETRYLINDFCVANHLPWVYAGVVGGAGLVLGIRPGKGACLRCLFPDPPAPGTLPTCDSAGVILPAVGAVASMAAGMALRWLAAAPAAPEEEPATLLELDAWNGAVRSIRTPRDPDCPACGRGEFPFLERADSTDPVLLCGRNAVQLPPSTRAPDLRALALNLPGGAASLVQTSAMVRFDLEDLRLTIFRDGRALIEGTQDPKRARALYDRVLSS